MLFACTSCARKTVPVKSHPPAVWKAVENTPSRISTAKLQPHSRTSINLHTYTRQMRASPRSPRIFARQRGARNKEIAVLSRKRGGSTMELRKQKSTYLSIFCHESATPPDSIAPLYIPPSFCSLELITKTDRYQRTIRWCLSSRNTPQVRRPMFPQSTDRVAKACVFLFSFVSWGRSSGLSLVQVRTPLAPRLPRTRTDLSGAVRRGLGSDVG